MTGSSTILKRAIKKVGLNNSECVQCILFIKSSGLIIFVQILKMNQLKCLFIACILTFYINANAQAENEIQVYASPTIGQKKTIAELQNNYTFKGSDKLVDARAAKWLNHT